MRALARLEWWYARNNLAAIARSPARLVLWSAYGLSLVLFALTRVAGARAHLHTPLALTHGSALAVAGGLMVVAGLTIFGGAGGRAATFRSPAEAILMSNAGLRPRTIALWLQLRRLAAGATVTLRGFFYAFLLVVPARGGPWAIARAFVATALLLAIPQAAGLPAFLIARGRAKHAVRAAGALLGALGLVYLVAGASGARWWQPLLRATHLDPSLAVRAALTAQPLAFIVPLALFACFVAIVVARGDDTLPELYAAGRPLAERIRDRRLRSARHRTDVVTAADGERVPAGASAILWKDWVVLRRNPRAFRLFLGGVLLWIVCGGGAAALTLRLEDSTALGTYAGAIALVILFWAPHAATTGLAEELAKPLFWLSTASLRTRLAYWTFARSWRGGAALGCGAAAAYVVLGERSFGAFSVPLAVLTYWSLSALGIGMYAAFPNPLDARGPTGLLRLAARFAYLAPAGLLATGVGLAHGGALASLVTFVAGLGLEGWLVIEIVAVRFTEYGATLATLSRAK